MGHDPMRVGTAARARGLTPNVHVTCVGQDRAGLRKTLEDLQALGIENVFALTGDWPRPRPGGPPPESPVFDLDSVQLVRLAGELRRTGRPLHAAVAVSPFKYVEGDSRLAVPEAREEDRGRRRLRDHPGRMGRGEVRGAQALPRRAWAPHPRARQRLRPRAASRRAHGAGRAAGVLGVPGAARDGAARGAGQGRRPPRPPRARRAHGRRASRAGIRRRVPRRHARRRPRRVDHPAREGAGAALGGAGPRSSATGSRGGFYLYGRPPERDRRPRSGRRRRRAGARPRIARLAVPTDAEAPWRRVIARFLNGLGRLFPVTRDTAAPPGARPPRRPGRTDTRRSLAPSSGSSSASSARSSAARPAATACSGTSSTCAPRPAPSTSATARAAARISGAARSSTSRASGSASMTRARAGGA